VEKGRERAGDAKGEGGREREKEEKRGYNRQLPRG